MNVLYVLSYIIIYNLFINSQSRCKISKNRMTLFFLKSKTLFYKRLLLQTFKNTYDAFLIVFIPLLIGVLLNMIHPILIVLLIMMYVSNCVLQYSRTYSYIKYVLYALPLIFFVFENIALVYLIVVMLAVIYFLLGWKFQFNLYEKNVLTFDFSFLKNKKTLLFSLGMSIYVLILLGLNYYNYQLPLEEGLVMIISFLIMLLEFDLSENKMLLTRVRSRFNLVRTKYKTISLEFLIPRHKNRLLGVFFLLVLSVAILAVLKQEYVGYSVLLMGGGMLILYIIDYVIYGLLSEESVVYENVVVKTILKNGVFAIVFVYMTYFMAGKYPMNFNTYSVYHGIFLYFKIMFFVLYSSLLIFFMRRFYRSFAVNKTEITVKTNKNNYD